MKETTVFVTYNPRKEFEQTLAIRLHTIGAVHGFNMLMPDRFNANGKMNSETVYRINSSDYFILFSTGKPTRIVLEEIKVAFAHLKDKSKILIIYDRVKNLKHDENCTEVFIDSLKETPQQILDKVIKQLKRNQTPSKGNFLNEDNSISVLGGIILIGLGLLALGSLVESEN